MASKVSAAEPVALFGRPSVELRGDPVLHRLREEVRERDAIGADGFPGGLMLLSKMTQCLE
jgi:hypothetical protein